MVNKFEKWIDTYFMEKGIDMMDDIEFTLPEKTRDGNIRFNFHIMPVGVIVAALKNMKSIHHKIKDMVVKIDFENGNIHHFLSYIGKKITLIGTEGF